MVLGILFLCLANGSLQSNLTQMALFDQLKAWLVAKD